MPRPAMTAGRRMFERLLHAYPAEFRDEYGREMRTLFRERYDEARASGPLALAGLWLSVLADTTMTAAGEHGAIARRDVRLALRSLFRDRTYLVAVVVVLAVGIGCATAVFGIVHAVLLRPLPYPDPTRLVAVSQADPRGGRWGFSEPGFLDLASRSRALTAVAAWRVQRGVITGTSDAEGVDVAPVSASLFDLLGLGPTLGRAFRADVDRPGLEDRQAVISARLWTRRFGHAPTVVGDVLRLDGRTFTIVGVVDVPPGLLDRVDVFVPLAADPSGSRTAREIDVLARLAPGVDMPAASAALDTLARQIATEHPASDAGWGLTVVPLRAALLGPFVTRALWALLVTVALLWFLACSNVASLVLARATARWQDIAVRVALGASRARLARELLTECALVSLFGGVAGLALASGLLAVVRRFGPTLVAQLEWVALDVPTVLTALGLAALSTVLFGLGPSLRASSAPAATTLLDGSRSASPRQRARSALVTVQVAIALVLLATAGLLVRSFVGLSRVSPGFEPDRVLSVQLSLQPPDFDDARRVAVLSTVLERVRAIPGVRAVGATNVAPFGVMNTANRFRLEEGPDRDAFRSAAWRSVTPGFFRALGLPLVRGRLLDDRDGDGAEEVVVITESMARRFWPGIDPVGRRLRWGSSGNPKRIVGIVGDVRDITLSGEPPPTMFRPYEQLTWPDMTLMVRVDGEPLDLAATVRDRVREVAPGIPLRLAPLAGALASSLLRPRVGAAAFSLIAGLALTVAVAGLAGLVAYDVRRRRRDTAIRVALGATRSAVLWHVQGPALTAAAIGAVLGVFASLAASRLIEGLLFDTRPDDPLALAGVAVVLVVAVLAAGHLAARAALRVNVIEALRAE